jgi:hypothetical protein
MRYYIFCSCGVYKLKIKDIKKMVAVAFNYEGELYSIDADGKYAPIYCPGEEIEFNNELLEPYSIRLDFISDGGEYSVFYKNIDLYEKYKDIEVDDIGKEVKD